MQQRMSSLAPGYEFSPDLQRQPPSSPRLRQGARRRDSLIRLGSSWHSATDSRLFSKAEDAKACDYQIFLSVVRGVKHHQLLLQRRRKLSPAPPDVVQRTRQGT